MGMGDEIMATAIVRQILATLPNAKKAHILDIYKRPRWSELWEGIEYIAKPNEPADIGVVNGPGARHYHQPSSIRDVALGKEKRVKFRQWLVEPGDLVFSRQEKDWAMKTARDELKHSLVIQPNYKEVGGLGSNKDWGLERWQKLVDSLPDVSFVQLSYPDATLLRNVRVIETPNFRLAVALMAETLGYVGHEGGMHHAAAAIGKPGVVIFGGATSPEITGYKGHINLYVPHPDFPLGCGSLIPCSHCQSAMNQISIEEVARSIRAMLSTLNKEGQNEDRKADQN